MEVTSYWRIMPRVGQPNLLEDEKFLHQIIAGQVWACYWALGIWFGVFNFIRWIVGAIDLSHIDDNRSPTVTPLHDPPSLNLSEDRNSRPRKFNSRVLPLRTPET
jgi:hypothetical protein